MKPLKQNILSTVEIKNKSSIISECLLDIPLEEEEACICAVTTLN